MSSAKDELAAARVVLVSACLLGERCRYDCQSKESDRVLEALEGKEVVPVCPEVAAGLGLPRPPVELAGGDGAAVLKGEARAVVRGSDDDVSAAFVKGAAMAVEAARRFGATVAILKERSPSCGTHEVYQDGRKVPGQGVAASALGAAGIRALSDEEV